MKWDGAVLLNCDPGSDRFIQEHAEELRGRYGVPPNRCFALYQYKYAGGFPLYTQDCLADPVCHHGTKLVILAHGTPMGDGVDGLGDARNTANVLCDVLGLEKAGLIAFKGCSVGAGSFLDDLRDHVDNRAEVGWYIGYKENVTVMGKYFGNFGGLRSHHYPADDDCLTQVFRTIGQAFGYKESDDTRVKVVKGNVNIIKNNSTRFNY
jgi:hypothetical protein